MVEENSLLSSVELVELVSIFEGDLLSREIQTKVLNNDESMEHN